MKSNFKTIVNSNTPVLIDFYADWCGPCKTLSPILKQLKDDFGEAIKIIKINVDTNQTLANKFQIRGVPTLLFFKEGKQLWRQSGAMTKDALKNRIGVHL